MFILPLLPYAIMDYNRMNNKKNYAVILITVLLLLSSCIVSDKSTDDTHSSSDNSHSMSSSSQSTTPTKHELEYTWIQVPNDGTDDLDYIDTIHYHSFRDTILGDSLTFKTGNEADLLCWRRTTYAEGDFNYVIRGDTLEYVSLTTRTFDSSVNEYTWVYRYAIRNDTLFYIWGEDDTVYNTFVKASVE